MVLSVLEFQELLPDCKIVLIFRIISCYCDFQTMALSTLCVLGLLLQKVIALDIRVSL